MTIFDSCLTKQQSLVKDFAACTSNDERYKKIIEMGKNLPSFDEANKSAENLVKGCQSQMFLVSHFSDGKVTFAVYSEALISAGLAALLLYVYNEESPEVILRCEPLFLDKIGMTTLLSPSRSNGLHSLMLQMKKEALKHLMTGK